MVTGPNCRSSRVSVYNTGKKKKKILARREQWSPADYICSDSSHPGTGGGQMLSVLRVSRKKSESQTPKDWINIYIYINIYTVCICICLCVLQMGIYLWEGLSDQRHCHWIFSYDKGERFRNLQQQSHGCGRLRDSHTGMDVCHREEPVANRGVHSCCGPLTLFLSGSFSLLHYHQNDHNREPGPGLLPRGELLNCLSTDGSALNGWFIQPTPVSASASCKILHLTSLVGCGNSNYIYLKKEKYISLGVIIQKVDIFQSYPQTI